MQIGPSKVEAFKANLDNIKKVSNTNYNSYLDIDDMRANPLYKAIITLPTGEQVIGHLDGGFNFATRANYEETMSMPSFADVLNQYTGMVANMANRAQFVVKSVRMTEARWTGSEHPTFVIKINKPVLRSTDNAWDAMHKLMKCTMSSTTNKDYYDSTGSFMLNAPNSYRVSYNFGSNEDIPQGTVSIKLGNWFEAHNMLITSVDHNLSEARLFTGDPVMYDANISFQFWRMPLIEDCRSWFKLI